MGAVRHMTDMVWLYHSGENGDILLVQMISTCLRGAYRTGGSQYPLDLTGSILQKIFFARVFDW
jgi:hypothetical protein